MSKSNEDRFWEKVEKSDTCWLWTASVHGNNKYGSFKVRDQNGVWKTVGAHIYSWILRNGPIPNGMKVLHNCPDEDNPRCVNPDHLWLGTQADNMEDRRRKGRARGAHKGVAHHNARFTDEDIENMKSLYATGDYTQQKIAEKFGCDQGYVSQVINGRRRN